MKKSVAFAFGLFLINFASAISYNYGSFSPNNFLSSISFIDMLVFAAIFIPIWWFVMASLSKFGIFRDRDQFGRPTLMRGPLGIVSACVAFLAVYGIYQTNFDLLGFSSGIGIPFDMLYPILSLVALGGLALLIWRFGLAVPLFVAGLATWFVIIFTDTIAEEGIASIIGIVLILAGLFAWRRSRARMMQAGGFIGSHYSGVGASKKSILILGVLLAIFGFVISNSIVIIIGIGLAVLGILIWFFARPRYPVSPGNRMFPGRPPIITPPPRKPFGLLPWGRVQQDWPSA